MHLDTKPRCVSTECATYIPYCVIGGTIRSVSNVFLMHDLCCRPSQALKLQQKMVPRALSDMQKNVSSAITALAAELSSFHRRLSDMEASTEASSMCIVGDSEEAGGSPQLHDTSQPAGNVQYKLDIQAIAVELAALRSAAERANRREFAMVSPLIY